MLVWFFKYLEKRLHKFAQDSQEPLDRGLFCKTAFFEEFDYILASIQEQIEIEKICTVFRFPILLYHAIKLWQVVFDFENYYTTKSLRQLIWTRTKIIFIILFFGLGFGIASNRILKLKPDTKNSHATTYTRSHSFNRSQSQSKFHTIRSRGQSCVRTGSCRGCRR